jgi:hypothetical protein
MKLWMTTAAAMMMGVSCALPARGQVEPNFQDQIIQIEAQIERDRDALPQVGEKRVRWFAAETKKEKAAFLGVVTAPVEPAMREQLKLPKGVGLTVERVEADSPAEQAGIRQYDVVQKIDDQWLINAHQLAVLVRMHKPGDEVTLSLVRQGQPMNVTTKLVEKELAVLDGTNLLGMPGMNVFGPEHFVAPEGSLMFRGPMHLEMDDVIKGAKGQSMMMSMSDDEHSMTLRIKDGHKHLTALDREGNIVFNGPVDTDEQRAALPETIKSKFEKLEARPGTIRMRIGTDGAIKPKAKPKSDDAGPQE